MASHLDNELKQSGITDSFQKELLAAGKADELSNERRQRLRASISLAIGAPALLPEGLGPAEFDPATFEKSGLNSPDGGTMGQLGSYGHTVSSGALPSGALPVSLSAAVTKAIGATILGGLSLWGAYSLLRSAPSSETPAKAVVEVPADIASPNRPSAPPDRITIMDRESSAPPSGISERVVAAESQANDLPESVTRSRKQGANDTLTRELALIETSRAELLRDNPTAALNTLGRYRKEFPKGTLSAEATVLKVEALIASGNRTAASQVGEAFLLRSPNSPYSRRISSLLGSTHDVGAKAATDPKR